MSNERKDRSRSWRNNWRNCIRPKGKWKRNANNYEDNWRRRNEVKRHSKRIWPMFNARWETTTEIALPSFILHVQNRQFCVNVWRCFSSDDEYDDEEQTIIEQIQQLQRQLEQTQTDFRHEHNAHTSSKEHLRPLVEILVSDLRPLLWTDKRFFQSNATQEQTSLTVLRRAREQLEPLTGDDQLFSSLKHAISQTIDHQVRWVSELSSLVDDEADLTLNETLRAIRRHFDELRREKEQLAEELALREETLRAERDHAVAEKEYAATHACISHSISPLQNFLARTIQRRMRWTAPTERPIAKWTRRAKTFLHRPTGNDQQREQRIPSGRRSSLLAPLHLFRLALDGVTERHAREDRSTDREDTHLRSESRRRGEDEKWRAVSIDVLSRETRTIDWPRSTKDRRNSWTAWRRSTTTPWEIWGRASTRERAREWKERSSGQTDVFKDQVRQFSNTIVQLEKKVQEEQEKRIRAQAELDQLQNQRMSLSSIATVCSEALGIPVVFHFAISSHSHTSAAGRSNRADSSFSCHQRTEVCLLLLSLTKPDSLCSQELFACKARVQEQEQIIVSLRRDLSGMTARLSDLQGELTEKQKRTLEKSETTVREQSKELNDTRAKLARLSEIVEKQTSQIDSLQNDLRSEQWSRRAVSIVSLVFSKSKVLADQYQLLVNQRQGEIERLTKSLEQKDSVVERVEKNNHDEVRSLHSALELTVVLSGANHSRVSGHRCAV